MSGILVDSNVILDVFENDPNWADWSESVLHCYGMTHTLYINPVIYSEISVGFERIEELEEAIAGCGFQIIQIPRQALFRAGKAFLSTEDGEATNYLPCRTSISERMHLSPEWK